MEQVLFICGWICTLLCAGLLGASAVMMDKRLPISARAYAFLAAYFGLCGAFFLITSKIVGG